MRSSHHHRPVHFSRIGFGVLAVVCAFSVRSVVWASALSAGTSLKVTVYQGVVSISPDGTSLMELGNLGQDIAGTGSLYLRPNKLSETLGAQVTKNGSNADLLVGSLCVYGSGSEDCRSGIPTGGAGDTFWKSVSKGGSYSVLTPSNADTGVLAGTWTTPTNGRALEVYANTVAPAVVLDGLLATKVPNWSNGVYQGGGDVLVNGKVTVVDTSSAGYLQTYYASSLYGVMAVSPWSQANQGVLSGLDADTFDGTTQNLNFPHAAPLDVFWKSFADSFSTSSYKACDDTGASCSAAKPCATGSCRTYYTATPNYKKAMCVHTTLTGSYCTSGPKAGMNCSVSADCGAGYTCANICQGVQATCPADPASGHGTCADNGAACTRDSDCSANTTCILGRQLAENVGTDPSCSSGASVCEAACVLAVNYSCDGSAASGSCAAVVGTSVRNSTGVVISKNGTSCVSTGPIGVYSVNCDCRLTQPVPYIVATPSNGGSGGDLCTKFFQ